MGESVIQQGMRPFIAPLIALALAAPVLAAEPNKDKQPVGQYVDISPVALPVIVDGQLINYVFVTLRLNLSPASNAPSLRDREPYFRDALVHTAYRHPFTVPTNYTQIDVKALKARMMAEAARIAGPGAVTSVELVGDPQPKKVTGLPKPRVGPPPPRAPIP
jgi:hypothetical protein